MCSGYKGTGTPRSPQCRFTAIPLFLSPLPTTKLGSSGQKCVVEYISVHLKRKGLGHRSRGGGYQVQGCVSPGSASERVLLPVHPGQPWGGPGDWAPLLLPVHPGQPWGGPGGWAPCCLVVGTEMRFWALWVTAAVSLGGKAVQEWARVRLPMATTLCLK